MYNFPELLKKIREEAGLTQSQFAKALDVSAVLIAMVETGKKDVSKGLILKLAEAMKVHPTSITPFLFADTDNRKSISVIEISLMKWGEKMQIHLIKNRAKNLSVYAK